MIWLTKSGISFDDTNRMLLGQRRDFSPLQVSINLATKLKENTTALTHKKTTKMVKRNQSYVIYKWLKKNRHLFSLDIFFKWEGCGRWGKGSSPIEKGVKFA